MSFPNFPDKYVEESLFLPEEYFSYLRQLGEKKEETPELVILCYSPQLMSFIANKKDFSKKEGLFIHHTGKLAVAGNFGIGAPAAALQMEEYIVRGTKKFLSFGTAGSLQKNLTKGDVLLIEKAIRDEGTSYHYLAPQTFAHASSEFFSSIEKNFLDQKKAYTKGASWTTDAFYRETKKEVLRYEKEGILCVDMEAAALFAVAEYRKVQCAAVFIVSDSLVGSERWQPEFHKIKKQFQETFDFLLEVLLLKL